MNRSRLTVIVAVGTIVLAACSPQPAATSEAATLTAAPSAPSTTASTTTPTTTTSTEAAPAATPVLSIGESGGCNMGGPRCRTRVLWSDGTVTIHRLQLVAASLPALIGSPTHEMTHHIDVQVVAELLKAIEGADWPAITSDLPPGTCWGCVDGIDFVVTIATDEGDVVLHSTATAFDPEVPEIAALHKAGVAMGRGIIFEHRSLFES